MSRPVPRRPAALLVAGCLALTAIAAWPAAGGASTGPPVFGPATVVDAQRTEGEPIVHVARNGDIWESGPFGASTNQSWIHKSTDDGKQYNVVSPIGLRPNLPPGGGDTDVITDDQGNAYFTDLEALAKIEASVSNDGGQSWRKNPAVEADSVDDRQWLAVDDGPTAAASDNTVFLQYRQVPAGSFVLSSPGSTGPTDPVGGVVWTPAAALPVPLDGAPCGQLRFDPVKRYLYLPCMGTGADVLVHRAHVAPGQRTGLAFETMHTPPSPGGDPGDLFPVVTTDAAGSLYAVWADAADHQVYYAASRNAGTTWTGPRQVSGADSPSNVFPWAVAAGAGRLGVAWYGSPIAGDSDDFPSWFNDRPAAAHFPWYGQAAVVTDADRSSPSIKRGRFTEKPTHYGQVCNLGTTCAATGGDRTMADYMSLTYDRSGRMRVVYNDTTSQHHGAHLFEARQLSGAGGFGVLSRESAPRSPIADPLGDALAPHYFPTGPGPNSPQHDFTELRVTQPNAAKLRVRMTLASLASLTPPPGKTTSIWITRFQARSLGDEGEDAYRIFYVGAQSQNGGPPTFFAGSGSSAQDAVPGNGCTTSTPETCKIVQYPAEHLATGSRSGNVLTVDVPVQGGFGPDRPILGTTLYSVTAFSGGRNLDTDVYADLDATRAFDHVLKSAAVVGPLPAMMGSVAPTVPLP